MEKKKEHLSVPQYKEQSGISMTLQGIRKALREGRAIKLPFVLSTKRIGKQHLVTVDINALNESKKLTRIK